MSEASAPDLDLLRRYRRGTPRAGAYPPLARYGRGFGEAQLRLAARDSNEDPIPRQLSLAVQLPTTCGDDDTRDTTRIPPYLNRLAREIELVAPLFDRDRDVVQLRVCGSCPGRLEPEQVGEIMYTLSRQFFFSRSRERDFSIELDPAQASPGSIARLADLGFNRASLAEHALEFASASAARFERCAALFDACRRAGFRSMEVELACGLTGPNPNDFRQAVRRLLGLRPERVVLARPPGTDAAAATAVPDAAIAEQGLQLLHAAFEEIVAAGYEAIGMDQFCLAGDDLARARRSGGLQLNALGFNNQADTDLLGFGVAAISQIAETRSQNHRQLVDWETALDRGEIPTARGLSLDADDRLRVDLLRALSCLGRLEIAELEERHEIHFALYFKQALAQLLPMQDDGLVELSAQRIRVTRRGRPFVAAVCAAFEGALTPALTGAP